MDGVTGLFPGNYVEPCVQGQGWRVRGVSINLQLGMHGIEALFWFIVSEEEEEGEGVVGDLSLFQLQGEEGGNVMAIYPIFRYQILQVDGLLFNDRF